MNWLSFICKFGMAYWTIKGIGYAVGLAYATFSITALEGSLILLAAGTFIAGLSMRLQET